MVNRSIIARFDQVNQLHLCLTRLLYGQRSSQSQQENDENALETRIRGTSKILSCIDTSALAMYRCTIKACSFGWWLMAGADLF
jgi:hypothetical protein